jgi:hypothetical protein
MQLVQIALIADPRRSSTRRSPSSTGPDSASCARRHGAVDVLLLVGLRQPHPGLVRRPFVNQGGTAGTLLTKELFEKLFEEWMEPGAVRIYKGVKNRAPSPNDDSPLDLQLFWGSGIVAAYVDPAVSTEDFSFAKGLMFAGLSGNGEPMAVLERDAPEIMPIGGREIRLVTSPDWKIVNNRSGWFWPAVIDKTNPAYLNDAGNSYFA